MVNPRPMVLPGSSSPEGPGSLSRFWTALIVAGGLLGVSLLGAAAIEIPYVTFEPGSARRVQSLIEIDAVPTYPADGSLLFTTVEIDDDVSLLYAVRGWLDPDIDLIPAERIFGDRSVQENREINLQLMDVSKDIAVIVALSRLGYDLNPTGTGAIVTEVVPGSAAEAVVEPGETIVGVDGVAIELREQLFDAIAAHSPGSVITLTLEDEARARREVSATLTGRPEDASVAFLGVGTVTRDFDPGLPFAVDIDSGEVGGPSAGLAFALSVIDVLTPGELTGGQPVAVTGTIEADGTVGMVGGVAQKAAAAASEGATVFIVPVAEFDEAVEHAHGMRIVAVDTLDDALAALAELGGSGVPDVAAPAP